MSEIRNIISEALEEFKEAHTPVMERYYGILSNSAKPRPINEMTLNRLIKKHAKNGMVIISANRSDEENRENNSNTRKLVKDIRSAGYSYFPVYGGYKGTDGVEDNFEPSFVVVPFDRSGNEMKFDKLAEFAIEMCGKYNQDSVYIEAPGDVAKYYDRTGKVVGKATQKEPILNDPKQPFFTELDKSKKFNNNDNAKLHRFTQIMKFECYMNPEPATLNERMRRRNWGEIIL